MPSVQELLTRMRANPKHVRFSDAKRVCDHYFGEPRIHGSHHVYRTPWAGETRGSTSKTAAAWSPHIKYVR